MQKCIGCGVEFGGRKRKYCSRECRTRRNVWQPIDRECPGCGTTFTATQDKHRYCTKKCYRATYGPSPKKHLHARCKWCKKDFHPKSIERIHYCSRDCSIVSAKHIRVERWILKRIQSNWRVSEKTLAPSCCGFCEKQFVAENKSKRYCSESCRRAQACARAAEDYQKNKRKRNDRSVELRRMKREGWKPQPKAVARKPIALVCDECGVGIKYPRSKFCSSDCSRAYFVRKHGSDHIARAKRNGCYWERVSRVAVLRRDAYTCQICGVKTNPEMPLGSPRFPTIDHIIPLSKKGPHVLSNLQCACWACNMQKGSAIPVGQLKFA